MADKKRNCFLNVKKKSSKGLSEKIRTKQSHNISPITEDMSHEEGFLDNDIEEGRQENSLCQLTKKVLQYIKNKKKINININELVKDLGVKKRRIYDITNVLQGIGYIEKKGKNEIIWIKNQMLNKRNIKIKKNSIKIINQINELNNVINNIKEELISISSKNDFNKYGYITFMDLKELSKNEKLDFLIIKGNIGSKVEIIDKKNSKKTCEEILNQFQEGKIELKQKNYKKINLIKNENHIFFDSNEQQSIKIYKINNGEINEIIKDSNKGVYYLINKDINLKNENKEIKNNENDNNYESIKIKEKNENSSEIINFKNINNNLTKSSFLFENKEQVNNIKKFSIYDFLKWDKNIIYSQNYNDIKNKYCGLSKLFQK
jgi:transcription factor E2F3